MKAKRALCMLAAILLVVAMMLMFLTGCNRQVIDTTFSYDNAILALPDGSVISGKIESWKDYRYSIRYGELIALNTHMIQKLYQMVEELLQQKEG